MANSAHYSLTSNRIYEFLVGTVKRGRGRESIDSNVISFVAIDIDKYILLKILRVRRTNHGYPMDRTEKVEQLSHRCNPSLYINVKGEFTAV